MAIPASPTTEEPLALVTDRAENVPLYRRVGFAEAWTGTTRDGRVRSGPSAHRDRIVSQTVV